MSDSNSKYEVRQLSLKLIHIDGDTQPRVAIDQQVVDDYADCLFRGETLPPAIVFCDGAAFYLVEGFHRWHAHAKANSDTIACEIHSGTLAEARWYSYAANRTHGLRRTNPDKAKAVKAALKHPNGVKLSDSQIAEHVGVSDKTVAKYREEMTASSEIPKIESRTVTRNGITYEQNTANIGKVKATDKPVEAVSTIVENPAPSPSEGYDWNSYPHEEEPAVEAKPEGPEAVIERVKLAQAPVVSAENFDAKSEGVFVLRWGRDCIENWDAKDRKALSKLFTQLAKEALQ